MATRRLQNIVIISEIALSLVLLVGALMLRSSQTQFRQSWV
jgi:hypothetical protein